MITEDYVSFEVAKLLKERGFDDPCLSYFWLEGIDTSYTDIPFTQKNMYEGQILRPTHQMACAWLRKNYNLHVCPKLACFRGAKKCDKEYYKWEDRVLRLPTNNQVHPQFMVHEYYNTYEEAVEAALKYSLENLI